MVETLSEFNFVKIYLDHTLIFIKSITEQYKHLKRGFDNLARKKLV